jgi:hypothetical protein
MEKLLQITLKLQAVNLWLAAIAKILMGRFFIAGRLVFLLHPVLFRHFVVMDKNGRFDFAIIASCGNPVNAHPTTVKQVPNTSSSTNTVIRQQPVAQPSSVAQTQSQSVTVAPTPSPAVTYTPPPAPVVYQAAPTTPSTTYVAPKQIPNTGIGDIAGIGSLVTLVSGFAHLLYKRKFIT